MVDTLITYFAYIFFAVNTVAIGMYVEILIVGFPYLTLFIIIFGAILDYNFKRFSPKKV